VYKELPNTAPYEDTARMRYLIAVFLCLLLPPSSRAGELYIYEHNGSIIDWGVVGDKITATYTTPRASLAAAGATQGALLFEGVYEGKRIIGRAYVFRRGCKPAPYEVIGYHEDTNVVLRGPAPKWAKKSCNIIGYDARSPNASLTFFYSATHH